MDSTFQAAYMQGVILGAAVTGIFVGAITCIIAYFKGRRAPMQLALWFLFGLIVTGIGGIIFGIVPIIITLFIENRSGMRCPVCKEWIKENATVCKHCHTVLADWYSKNPDVKQ